RLSEEAGETVERRVDLAFRLALGRGPTEAERWRAESFARHGSLREFALAVLNLNGFLYVQ
ncbi:MAG: hypothetical protein AB7O38_30815, partial [Pirellulaceae bacterium]